MKALRYSLLLLCLVTFTAFSQARPNQKSDQIKSLKVAFITNELDLTPEESAKFWPLYNTYEEKQRDLRKKKVSGFIDRRDDSEVDKMTDKEASVLLAQMEDNEEELYQARKRFITSLKGVLPAIKIIRLKKAEEDFNRKLLKQYRERRKR